MAIFPLFSGNTALFIRGLRIFSAALGGIVGTLLFWSAFSIVFNAGFVIMEHHGGKVFCMNKKTVALTAEQYKAIIDDIRTGHTGMRPNPRVATALVIEGNLGLRIGDILQLKLSSFIRDGDRYRLDITEQKTGKKRSFTVPYLIYQYIENYCLKNQIRRHERIFPISVRTVQAILQASCDWLGYENISTHSFRKFYATEIYKNNDYNIVLVQTLLQHSSPAITQRYIGLQPKEVEDAILGHMRLL